MRFSDLMLWAGIAILAIVLFVFLLWITVYP
jgi:hypothetical protein